MAYNEDSKVLQIRQLEVFSNQHANYFNENVYSYSVNP